MDIHFAQGNKRVHNKEAIVNADGYLEKEQDD
jgi:hypothetical protein